MFPLYALALPFARATEGEGCSDLFLSISPADLCPRCWQLGRPREIGDGSEPFDEQMNATECAARAMAAGATAW